MTEDAIPYTVESLAARWQCSESVVRKIIRAGQLRSWRVGVLIRIGADEVERYERCQSSGAAENPTGSRNSEADSPSSGGRLSPTASRNVAVNNSRREIAKAPRRKRELSGKEATIVPGPWGGS
ncbi:excisionase family DNA-binding protein [Sphingobium phenoxybenzoativorans]|uniref:Excisionase family DNA-binding protein n=1 Tax=Sphingobium phenoxybenzoativorans TaxID=1592790 RepID=A0A975K322_9SPHN|nr:excisionase family DNA-binding protein [Sphingobium phenoxybenzoativorans]